MHTGLLAARLAGLPASSPAGLLARLPALLAEHKPELVILELGGNDGLRGMPPTQLQQNLASMIDSSRQSGAKVLLLGMQLPPNYGKRYTDAFAEVYGKLADVVIDPIAKQVTHLVVEPKNGDDIARLVPIDLVENAVEPVAIEPARKRRARVHGTPSRPSSTW